MGSLRWSGSGTRSVLAGVATLVLLVGVVGAEPLGKDVCDSLLLEEQTLIAAGARGNLDRGPEWGRVNLAPAQLKQVQRFITVTEDLVFRCGLAGQRFAAFVEPEPPPPAPAKKAAKVKPKTSAKPSADTKGKAMPAPQPSPAKPKQKADDAYRPPAKAAPAEAPRS